MSEPTPPPPPYPSPTEEDLAVAYECLRRVPFDVSPVQHLGRIIARYRMRLQARQEAAPAGEGADPDEEWLAREGAAARAAGQRDG